MTGPTTAAEAKRRMAHTEEMLSRAERRHRPGGRWNPSLVMVIRVCHTLRVYRLEKAEANS